MTTQTEEAWEEARRRAVQAPPVARVKPLGFGCVAVAVLAAWASLTFAIAIVAAIYSHGRGWS